jgi:hypothetical protein
MAGFKVITEAPNAKALIEDEIGPDMSVSVYKSSPP